VRASCWFILLLLLLAIFLFGVDWMIILELGFSTGVEYLFGRVVELDRVDGYSIGNEAHGVEKDGEGLEEVLGGTLLFEHVEEFLGLVYWYVKLEDQAEGGYSYNGWGHE
jgi:hypothetical protein